MVVETFPDGRHNFTEVPQRQPAGPARAFTTTLQLRAGAHAASSSTRTTARRGAPSRATSTSRSRSSRLPRRRRASAAAPCTIQQYEPMWADMSDVRSASTAARSLLDRIDLETDGATSPVTGVVDVGALARADATTSTSRVHFPRMREIFFAQRHFTLAGEGDFAGTFHLFKGGRELTGTFTSDEAGAQLVPVPGPARHAALGARALRGDRRDGELLRRHARFDYTMAPLGKPDAGHRDVRRDVHGRRPARRSPTSSSSTGLRLAGRATGRNLLEWPLGQLRTSIAARAPSRHAAAGVALMTRARRRRSAGPDRSRHVYGDPFTRRRWSRADRRHGRRTVRSRVGRRSPRAGSRRADDVRRVRGAHGVRARSRIPFHVTSARLAGERPRAGRHHQAFGSPTRAVPVGGAGSSTA